MIPERRDPQLRLARVLVELGELAEAEALVVEVLEREPEQLDALSLLSKLKHIRGELTLAVACTAQVEARRVGEAGTAAMHLESMLRLAQDPERGAGEFVAVGQFQLVRKPTAYLALEEAFQLFVARKPKEARAVCRATAERHRERDPDLTRLAGLAEAWISELAGQLEDAAATLERLGSERGFETDLDRLTALVRVYERLGTPERLVAALKVYQYLEGRLGAVAAVLGRMAALHRRLGKDSEAATYEQRHLASYRDAMHRPGPREIVDAASLYFIPLPVLAARLSANGDLGSGPDVSVRGQAIVRALAGDTDDARALFERGVELLDLKYLASLEALVAGDAPGPAAVEAFVRAFRADPADLGVLGWMLAHASAEHDGSIENALAEPELLARAVAALERAVQLERSDPAPWRWLAALFGMQAGGEEQERQMNERAMAAERAALNQARACGRALSAAVYHFFGAARGLIHEVWATREVATPGRGGLLRREDILGTLTDEMKSSVRNTFLAVREYSLAKFPHQCRDLFDYNYWYKVTKEDEPSSGVSAGLPTALAFLSTFLQKPLPQDVAFTGTVVTDAHDVLIVRPVGDIEAKVDAAYHRNLRMIVVPGANRVQLEQGGRIPAAVIAEIVRYANDLDEAVQLVFGADAFV